MIWKKAYYNKKIETTMITIALKTQSTYWMKRILPRLKTELKELGWLKYIMYQCNDVENTETFLKLNVDTMTKKMDFFRILNMNLFTEKQVL